MNNHTIAGALTALAALLGAVSCAGQAQPRCDLTASQAGRFTSGEDDDLVEARAFGADCSAAIVVFSVRTHEGLPVYAWAAPLYPTFGEAFAPGAEEGGRGEVQTFLDRWVQAEFSSTHSAPEWSAELSTPLAQATYDDLRARNAPMLCFLTHVAQQTCVYWESAAASAAPLLHRDASARPMPE